MGRSGIQRQAKDKHSPNRPFRNMPAEYYSIGHGPPIIMLHSSMSSKEQWRKLASALRDSFQVIAIDLSGYGDADFPPHPESFSLKEEAERIDCIISQCLGMQPFHLVGHSYGGATGLRLAYTHPERIKSLALYEPVAFHLLDPSEAARIEMVAIVKQINGLRAAGDDASATRLFVDFWSGTGTYDTLSDDKRKYLDGLIAKVALDFQAGFGEPLQLRDYSSLSMPACLLTSPESPLPSRQITKHLQVCLPKVQVHQTNGGHMSPITNATQVNRILESFLRLQHQ